MAAKKTTKRKATKRRKTASKRKARKPRATKARQQRAAKARDPRLPAVGKTIVREFKGQRYELRVTADGFALGDVQFRSLTAAARAISGYGSVSGWAFFGLAKRAEKGGA